MSNGSEKYNILLPQGEKEVKLIIEERTGDALPLHEPRGLVIDGTIEAPCEFVKSRVKYLEDKTEETHVIVDAQKGLIRLITEEKSAYRHQVTGKIIYQDHFLQFGFFGAARDDARMYNPDELKNLLKLYGFYLNDDKERTEWLIALSKFSAVINTSLEDADDEKGKMRQSIEANAKTNLPESIVFKMPVFLGGPEYTFKAEVKINVRSKAVDFWLESRELLEIIEKDKEAMLQQEVKQLKESGFAVFYCNIK